MPNPAFETVDPPFTTFRFEVVLNLDSPVDGVTDPVCNAAFAECDGLEMTMEPKTFRQGGDSATQIHRMGPVSYSQLTLKRGMTNNLQLWAWFRAATTTGRVSTAQGHVTMWDSDGTPRITFDLVGCLPVKMRAPSLNAQTGLVAIEEIHLVYASMSVRPAGAAAGGIAAGASFGASVSAGIGFSAGASASFGASVSGGPGLNAGFGASASAGFDLG